MSQETTQACVLPSFERNRYFFGKPMTVRDFEAEQQYVIGKHRALNRLIHGAGILCGMGIQELKLEDGKLKVKLSEGAALDCCGNLIIVNQNLDKIEVKGATSDGTFHLYVKFAECERQPIIASANTSNCEEVCSYNRIRETFEVFAVAPEAVPAARSNGAGASQPETQSNAVMALVAEDGGTSVCNELAQSYFEEHSGSCPPCDNPRVFLGIFTIKGAEVAIDPSPQETRRLRSVVYTNPMLHGLLCEHLTSDNPHNTLESINGVGFVPNIQLLHDESITIENNVADKTITVGTAPPKGVRMVGSSSTVGSAPRVAREDHVHTIAERVVERKHLTDDLVGRLFVSDGSVTLTQLPSLTAADRQIQIKTNQPRPASEIVTGVAFRRVLGIRETFAREDHVHDLDENVVGVEHLTDAVFDKLLVSPDGSIGITHNEATNTRTRQIQLTARLSLPPTISGVGPDSKGNVELVAGNNVKIAPDREGNQITISADVNPLTGPPALTVTSGLVMFEAMGQNERRPSLPIRHGLRDARNFAIVLGLADKERLLIGDLSVDETQRDQGDPLFLAEYKPGEETFVIYLIDGRRSAKEPTADYLVRWWAIPSTSEMDLVVTPRRDDEK